VTIDRDVISAIRLELQGQSNEKTRTSFQRFFKEGITCYGVKSADVSQIARRYFSQIKPLGKQEIWLLCEKLLQSDYSEETTIAFDWSYRLHNQYTRDDFAIFENWLRKYVNNWAKCDTLCNHAIGALVIRYPELIGNLKQWTPSTNRWLRRGAAVTLIIPARNGQFLKDIFDIADSLITDEDDMVQKGYGWLLKEASRKHQQELFDYVMKHKAVMPRTALRYAIELLPVELKHRAMEKPKNQPGR